MQISHFFAATAMVAVCSSPAVAGETIRYEAAPQWVVEADLDAALAQDETLVLFDRQVRMEGGTVYDYVDVAVRIDNPQALTQLGTRQLQWLPDKGDLYVHALEIVRDGEQIDLLAQGVEFDVIRREEQLESRLLDGMLTATLAVPGLRVGDVLRVRHSTTNRDQALDGEMQVLQGVFSEPLELGFGRVVVSWPETLDVDYQVTRGLDLPPPVTSDGYTRLTLEFPVAEMSEMPADSPSRYQQDALLQVGTYDGWRDVSSKMATHFTTAGTIAPGGEVAAEIARIERTTKDPLERAALALQTVQNEIAYHLNGLDGGNYLPQSPQETWDLRYGDCKAKSLLLLAMLREMGIESEAVLVRSQAGDWVSEMLPMPGNFDHMIVRATIAGEEYWLDGTNAGIRLSTIGEVPRFFYALPLRDEGAELMPVAQRWQEVPDRIANIEIDHSAGFDYPALFELDVTVEGSMAAQLQNAAKQNDRSEVIGFASNYSENLIGENIVYSADVTYDEASGKARVRAKGITDSWWTFDRDRATLTPWTSSNGFEFSPDRARREWRDIPYQVGGPMRVREDVTIRLPEGRVAYDLRGTDVADEIVGGSRITRTASLEGNSLRVMSDKAEIPVEIPADEIAQQRRAAARLKSGDYMVRVNEGVQRYWQLSEEEASKRLAELNRVLETFVAIDPSEAWRYAVRASLRNMDYNYAGAVADLTRAIELEPNVQLYSTRAAAHARAGDLELAMDDALYAYELQGDVGTAVQLAQIMAEAGDLDGALTLLEDFDLGGDERIGLMQLRAEYEGEAGRAGNGWSLLQEVVADRPGDANLLNAQCWYMGTWKHRLDEAEALCSEAVQASQYAPNVLDSRALAYYRLGQHDKAIGDLDAALRNAPDLAASRYLKGVILLEQGRTEEGRAQIAYATRIEPRVAKQYERYGITLPE